MEEEKDFYEMLWQGKQSQELARLAACNEDTARFGLSLSQEEALELAACRNESLRKWRRVEFGKGILETLIWTVCDSPYLEQDNYMEMLARLQDIFYEFKDSTADRVTDRELLNFMREQFDEVCFGDADYLEDTCLDRFAAGVRAGYSGYQQSEGRGVYEQFSGEARWDKGLYLQALKDLCWR